MMPRHVPAHVRPIVVVLLLVAVAAAATAQTSDGTGISSEAVDATPGPPPTRLQVFAMQHGRAESAAELIGTFLPRGSCLAADARTNKIIVMSSDAGLEIAAAILAAVDEPDPVSPTSERPRAGVPRLYDYEVRRGAYGVALRDEGTARERVRPPFERAAGVLVERDDESITIARDRAAGPLRLMLPRLLSADGEWRPRTRLAESVDGLTVGSHVVVEWWQADDTIYLENVATPRTRRQRVETSILGD